MASYWTWCTNENTQNLVREGKKSVLKEKIFLCHFKEDVES